jgi:hypothetical protein
MKPEPDSDAIAEAISLLRWTLAAWESLVRNERAAKAKRILDGGKVIERAPQPSVVAEAEARRASFELPMLQALTSKSSDAISGLRRLQARYGGPREVTNAAHALASGAVPAEFTTHLAPGVPVGRDRQLALAVAAASLTDLLAPIYDSGELPPDDDPAFIEGIAEALDALRACDPEADPTATELRDAIGARLSARMERKTGASGARFDARTIIREFTDVSEKTTERAIMEAGLEAPVESDEDEGP